MIPILVGMLVDKYYLDNYLQKNSPITFDFVIWFNVFFNFPHIICSSLLFVDKQYLSFFRKSLLILLMASAVFVVVFIAFRSSVMQEMVTLFALVWTIKHVVGQQFSMTRIFLRAKEDWAFLVWKHYGIFIASLMFLGIYARVYTRYFSYIRPLLKLFEQQPWPLLLPFFVTSVVLALRAHRANNQIGARMVYANVFMMVGSCFLFSEQYFCLAALGPRVIHDLSAFYFYGVHSYNKGRVASSGWFTNFFKRLQPIPLFMLSSTLGVFVMFYCMKIGDLTIYHALSAIHFYTESFFWKADSPARKFLSF